MRIIDRYIVLDFVRNLLIALFALTFIFFIADYLRGIWDQEVSALHLLQYSAYLIPQTLCQMLPPAAMLGTLITLSLLNRKSELTAIFASGISLGHITFLIFGAIFISCCFSLVTYDRIVPPLARNRLIYLWKTIKGRHDFSLDIKTSKIWYRSKNYIYNLRLYDKSTSTIQGIGIYYFNDKFKLMQHVEADNARYNFSTKQWELKNGMLTIFPENKVFPMSKHFVEKHLILPETPKDFMEIEKQVDTLRIKDLRSFITRNKDAGVDTKIYEVDFHSRLAISFAPLVMGLLAIPFSVRNKRQGGLAKDIAICVGWIFLYWLIFSISVSLGKSGALAPAIAVWGPSGLFLLAALVLVLRYKST